MPTKEIYLPPMEPTTELGALLDHWEQPVSDHLDSREALLMGVKVAA